MLLSLSIQSVYSALLLGDKAFGVNSGTSTGIYIGLVAR